LAAQGGEKGSKNSLFILMSQHLKAMTKKSLEIDLLDLKESVFVCFFELEGESYFDLPYWTKP